MNHFSLAYDTHSKYLYDFFESSKRTLLITIDDYLEDFLESSEHIFQIIMDNYFDGLLEDSNRILLDNSDLIKIAAALFAVGLMVCSIWYYTSNKNKAKLLKIDNEIKIFFMLEKEFDKSTISTISVDDDNLSETSRTFFQEKIEENGSMTKTLGTPYIPLQEESNVTIKGSCQEQDGAKTKDPETLYQGSDKNSLENDSTRLTPETASQETCHKVVIQSDVHEPEASVLQKSYKEDLETQSQESDNNSLANDSTWLTPETEIQKTRHKMIIQSDVHDIPEASVQPKSYKDPETLSQESDNNPLADYSTELTSETENQKTHKMIIQSDVHEPEANAQLNTGLIPETENQKTCHKMVIQLDAHEPEVNVQPKGYEEDPEILSQESDNPLANDSITEAASQETCHKMVIQSDACQSEASVQPKSYEEIQEKMLHIKKTDSPIMQTGLKYTDASKTESESEVSSQSDLSDIDENVDPTPIETKYEDACVQTEPQVSRSIILNDQIPVIMPLPNETALDVLHEFSLSTVVHAFTGQDLIDLEDYDEAEEIRRFLFKKNI